MSQLVEKDCNSREYRNIFPITTLDNIMSNNGVNLKDILNQVNHIYLPFKNRTRRDTRLQVPNELRRRGLWVTYISCKGNIVTEWYNAQPTDNDSWVKNENWTRFYNGIENNIDVKEIKETIIKELQIQIKEMVKEIVVKNNFNWYKN